MGITIKSAADIQKMREAGRIVEETLELLSRLAKEGVSTEWLDKEAAAFIRSSGAEPSFLGYNGYPKSICTSVNCQVVHGIPGDYRLRDGDILSVDVGAQKAGWHGDAARTLLIGNVKPEVKRLVEITRECFFKGIERAIPGNHISDISAAIQTHAESNGYTVVRELIGHGIGTHMHEQPDVPNFIDSRMGRGVKLVSGMTIAVEPMINLGTRDVVQLSDGWTVQTSDGLPSAHYENTIVITDEGAQLLTLSGGTHG
ncbi:MAG: type I methionyl aminopeptidase [Clostridia bacterium]